MENFDQSILKEAKKKSEERARKFKIAGRIISGLLLIVFFSIGVLSIRELIETVDLYLLVLILIITIGFSLLSIWIIKKYKREEKNSTQKIIIELVITIFTLLSIYLLIRFTLDT
jgi:Mn2+/Fe2+ NRAMP family transporter